MLKNTGLIFIIIIFGLTSNLFAQDQQVKNDKEIIGSEIPVLKIQTPDSVILTNKDFQTKGHLFLITINPTCGHCNNLGALINEHADLFKHSKVVFMMTPTNALNLDFFTNTSHIGQHPELIVGVDQNGTIEKLDDSGLMPYTNIYKEGELVQKLSGDVSLEDLKKYIP